MYKRFKLFKNYSNTLKKKKKKSATRFERKFFVILVIYMRVNRIRKLTTNRTEL
jgi:hypothetical protein